MENASKALLLAAGVLLGLMIISVATILFQSFGGSGKEIVQKIENSKLAEFNEQFLKYWDDYGITAHDVVTIINLAESNNKEYEVENQPGASENSYYIQVDFLNQNNMEKKPLKDRIELIQNEEYTYEEFQDDDTGFMRKIKKPYKISNISISKKTGRVNYIKITTK